VSLGNVIPASYQQTVTPFLSDKDQELLAKYRVPAFEVLQNLKTPFDNFYYCHFSGPSWFARTLRPWQWKTAAQRGKWNIQLP
jgi:hypothetical protein